MKKTGIIILLIVLVLAGRSNSQLYNQSLYHLQNDNPAYVGSWGQIGMTASANKGYMSSFGSSSSFELAVQSPIAGRKSGIGLAISNEHFQAANNFNASADYSYKFNLKSDVSLRLGFRGGFTNYNVNLSSLVFENDEMLTSLDYSNSSLLSLGAGAFLNSNEYYLSVAMPKILRRQISGELLPLEQNILLVNAGYTFALNQILRIVPTINIAFLGEDQFVTELNANFLFYDRIWIGGGYQFGDVQAVGANLNFMLNKQLMLGYVYGHYYSSQGYKLNYNSHGLVLSYSFILNKKRILSPRWF